MMDGLLEKIQAIGYWRVNIRPTVIPVEKLSFADCEGAVDRSRVELRGWDFPHVSRRQDPTHGHARAGEFVENWIDWEVHVEFWRMYRSSQFITYRALWEDLDKDRHNGRQRPADKVLSVGSAIYTFTEVVEFLYRLYQNGHYALGAQVSITLGGAPQRHLWINDPNRMPFSDEKVAGADTIEVVREFDIGSLQSADHGRSLEMVRELFEHFGWDVAASTIVDQQARFLRRQA
jgi:hypothetical protein